MKLNAAYHRTEQHHALKKALVVIERSWNCARCVLSHPDAVKALAPMSRSLTRPRLWVVEVRHPGRPWTRILQAFGARADARIRMSELRKRRNPATGQVIPYRTVQYQRVEPRKKAR